MNWDKKIVFLSFLLYSLYAVCQDINHFSLQSEFLYGNIIRHKNKIAHLAISHPRGFSLSYNRKTSPKNKNLIAFNYPDYGATFSYLDLQNPKLGNLYSLQGHYNFYFGNRSHKNQFYFKLAQGIAYNTNPFDLETNNKNISFGSHLLANTTFGLHYLRKQLLKAFDINLGLQLSHFSNGAIKSPNIGLNLWSVSMGMCYNFDHENPVNYNSAISRKDTTNYSEPIKLNLKFSGGLNSSSHAIDKQYAFYTGTAYMDKRINRKSILQFGGEIFFSNFLKELIQYNAVAFPEFPEEDGSADYKRVSILVGHELYINKFSLVTQLGYYVYYPYEYEKRYYERLGIKKYFGEKWFLSASIKAHLFIAESVDLGLGIRL